MKINEVKYMKRANLGNYEHEEITIGAAVEEGETVGEVLTLLKSKVEAALAGKLEPVEAIPTTGKAQSSSPTATDTAKTKGKKGKPAPAPEPEAEAETVEDDSLVDDENADDAEGIIDDEELTEEDPTPEPAPAPAKKVAAKPAPAAAKTAAKAAPKAKKMTPYDRANQLHKKLFVELLNVQHPGWKTKAPAKAKDVSVSLSGTDFLDAEGSVVDSFKAATKAAMLKK